VTAGTPALEGAAPYCRRSRNGSGESEPVEVVLPDEPPQLTPGAARALLKILLRAHARIAEARQEQENTT
jgi:hypothetical protein